MFHKATSETPDLLASWRWLVGEQPQLHGWSSSGDLFYVDAHGAVWWLETGGGSTERAAESRAAFEAVLRDPEAGGSLLLAPVVHAWEEAHGKLATDRCLGFLTLPVLGGAYTIDNRVALPIVEHAGLTGEVHCQIRDLPDGATVRITFTP